MFDDEYQSLASHIPRTEAARLDEARAVTSDCADAREAWEALAAHDLIPSEWIEDPRREFASFTCSYRWSDVEAWMRCVDAYPMDVEDAVTRGADASAVRTAEALAREIVQGLASWRIPQPESIRWWIAEDELDRSENSTRGVISPIVRRSLLHRAYVR
jgi:hypothetical protein